MNLSRRLTAVTRPRIDYGLNDLRGDILGGIAAAGIVLPVAIGYGVLSGLGPVAGLHGAVAVGFFASLFGGTRGLVYGPNIAITITITMAVVVSEYADTLPEAATIGILAGLIQIIFGLLGLGRYASYIPISLTWGFFTAFGVLIIVKQSFPAIGVSTPHGSVITSIRSWPEALTNVNFDALALTVVCITLAVLWRGRLLRLSPALFVVLIVGVLAGALVFRGAPTVGEIPSGLPSLQLSAISLDFFLRALQPAFIMALLGSVSTVLLALRADAITGTQQRPNREMFAQGMGNMAAGPDWRNGRVNSSRFPRQRPKRRQVTGGWSYRRGDYPRRSPVPGPGRRANPLCRVGCRPDGDRMEHHRLANSTAGTPHLSQFSPLSCF